MSAAPQSRDKPRLPVAPDGFMLLPAARAIWAKAAGLGSSHSCHAPSNLDWRPTMTEVTDNVALGRYEMVVDGMTAFVTYRPSDREAVQNGHL